MSLADSLSRQISAATGRPFDAVDYQELAGGCINRAAMIEGRDGRRYFVKLNDVVRLSMFEAEADGLRELERAGAVRVPRPLCQGSAAEGSFLVLEHLTLRRPDQDALSLLGQQLAALHHVTGPRFGWDRDNTIGSTAQLNDWCDDWVEFFRERRLRYQLDLAASGGGGDRMRQLGAELLQRMPALFADYRPPASVLHGDLWGGNVAATVEGVPVIFDPAVYFGDREADLAMTELFGGFSERFYHSYRDAWPLDPGYAVRKTLYNLYHVLNHFNLFGGAYRAQAERMLQQLLSELR
jgi:fructosamine-3-kinase